MLSLAALTFSMMKEVQAADPNVTFLDDDSITYKDLAHGVFELVTKEAIPRHIIVEDPGETIVLNPRGSSVSVNQVANTPTRMAELQEAQQDVLANFAKGLGPSGSSTPPFFNPLPVQPINFIENDDHTATQNSLPPLPSIVHPNPRDLDRSSAACVAANVQRFRRRRSKSTPWRLTISRQRVALSLPAVPTTAPH